MDRETTILVVITLPLLLLVLVSLAAWRMNRLKATELIFTHSARSVKFILLTVLVCLVVANVPIVIALLDLQDLGPLRARDYGELSFVSTVGTLLAAWGGLPPFLEYAKLEGRKVIWHPALGLKRVVNIDDVLVATYAKGPNSMGVVMKTSARSVYVKATLEPRFWKTLMQLRPDFPFSDAVLKALKLSQ